MSNATPRPDSDSAHDTKTCFPYRAELEQIRRFAEGLAVDEPDQDPLAAVADMAAKALRKKAGDCPRILRARLRKCEKLLKAAYGCIDDELQVHDEEEQSQPMMSGHVRVHRRIAAYLAEVKRG